MKLLISTSARKPDPKKYKWFIATKKVTFELAKADADAEFKKGEMFGIRTLYGKRYILDKSDMSEHFQIDESEYDHLMKHAKPFSTSPSERRKAKAKIKTKAKPKYRSPRNEAIRKEQTKLAEKKQANEEKKEPLTEKEMTKVAEEQGSQQPALRGMSKESVYGVSKILIGDFEEATPEAVKKVFSEHGHDSFGLFKKLRDTFGYRKQPDSTSRKFIGFFADLAGLYK